MESVEKISLLFNELLQKRGLTTGIDSQENPVIKQLVEDFMVIRDFTHAISNGDLSQNLEIKGFWAGALKALQANLRHLTWQAKMVESGDYSQHVAFMGDFSIAFNTMIRRLEQAEENEKKYIQALEESEQKYRLIAENTDDVILLMDENLNVTYVSPSIEKLLGYHADEFRQLPVSERVLPLMETTLRNLLKTGDLYQSQNPMLLELEQRCKNGNLIWMESLISIARNDQGVFSGFLCVTRNITIRKQTENLLQRSYIRRQRNSFLNDLLNGLVGSETETYAAALRMGIQFPRQFSMYFLELEVFNLSDDNSEALRQKQRILDTILDMLNAADHSTIAWEAATGIGILQRLPIQSDRKTQELVAAKVYANRVQAAFPDIQVRIGISDYFDSITYFARRFNHAKSAVTAGRVLAPNEVICHFEDCGVYQVMTSFAATEEADLFIEKNLGPLIAYDQLNGTDLVFTLEKILAGPSIKEVANQIFVHHKTIAFRKQRIEKILNVMLESADTRMLLGTALRLQKIAQLSKI